MCVRSKRFPHRLAVLWTTRFAERKQLAERVEWKLPEFRLWAPLESHK